MVLLAKSTAGMLCSDAHRSMASVQETSSWSHMASFAESTTDLQMLYSGAHSSIAIVQDTSSGRHTLNCAVPGLEFEVLRCF